MARVNLGRIVGQDGKEVLLQVNETYIQWKHDGDATWQNLIALANLKGADGKGITNITINQDGELVITFSDNTTSNLGTVVGQDGKDGKDGKNGTNGTNGQDGEDGRGIVSITKTGTSGLVDTYTITYTDGTTSTFDVTNGSGGGGIEDDYIPEHWVDYMNLKKEIIKDKCNMVGRTGDGFVFITDMHDKLNYGNSPLLINYILKNTPIRKVVFGGDLWSDGNNIPEKSQLIKNLYDLRLKYNFTDNIFAVRGNHDVERNISDGEWYSMYERTLTEFVETIGQEVYFYRDNASQKIRYIYCDGPNPGAAMPIKQQNWLKERITELEEGWTVLVFCHSYWEPVYIGGTPGSSVWGRSIVSVMDAAEDLCEATIAALITGHVHKDMSTQSTKGYAIIGTTCDANDWLAYRFDPVTPNRTEGTTTEQVFDVFNIDTANKKIYVTRIGGNGTDREFTYFKDNVPLQSLSINADNSYTGKTFKPTVSYTPAGTTQKGVTWEITEGSQYATINSGTGVVTIDEDADEAEIIIKATSTYNSSITATKTITVTYDAPQPGNTDITDQFTFTANPLGFATGWATEDTGASHNLNMNPGTNGNLQHSNFVNIEDYDKLIVTNITRQGATGPSGPTGGWAFYGSNDTTDTITLTTPYTYNGVTCYDGPAQFIEDGAMDRQHNGTQEGITTDTLTIPDGAKYIRVTKWTNDTYGAFSCIGVIE